MNTFGKSTVAYLEDDALQNRRVTSWLLTHGFTCHSYSSAAEIIEAHQQFQFDAALLDWHLDTGSSGLEVLKHLRSHRGLSLPIIVLSSRNTPEDIAHILNAGADDFLSKPAKESQVLGLLDSYLHKNLLTEHPIGQYGRYVDDKASNRWLLDGSDLELSAHEYALVSYIFDHTGQSVSIDDLLAHVCGESNSGDRRRIVSDMNRLKKKLSLSESGQWALQTILDYGYRLIQINGVAAAA